MSRVCLALLALVAVALPVAGCGGSSPKTTAGTTATGTTAASSTSSSASNSGQAPQHGAALHDAAFIAQANAICKRARVHRKQLKTKSGVELELALPQMAAYQRAEYLELSKLTPPAAIAADWRRLVADNQAMAATIVKLYEGARANLPASAGRPLWSALTASWEDIRKISARNGLHSCVRIA